MADTDTTSPFPSFFWGNSPNVNQQLRQRMALQMMANKKAYPKNIGEGLSAIGDAIGERGLAKMLEQQDVAAQGVMPPAAPSAPAMGQRSEAEPSIGSNVVASASPDAVAAPPTQTADAADPWINRSRAISGIETGGEKDPYTSIGAATRTGDRAHGKYQVMGANIPEWTKAATGTAMTPQQFLASRDAQEAVFKNRFGGYVDKYGEEGAARAWFGGEKGMKNLAATDVHGRLNVGQYGQDYLSRLNGPAAGANPRDAIAATLAGRASSGPPDAQDARLADVTGMSGGPTGAYSYAPTASRSGDVQSDAPSMTGVSPATGAAVADTIQQQARPPAPEVPQANPTMSPSALTAATAGSPPEAQDNRPIVMSDIKPQPAAPVPGAQMAQADPGYVTPQPSDPTGAPIIPMKPREVQLRQWLAANQGNPYAAMKVAPELQALETERTTRQNEASELYKAKVAQQTKLVEMRQQQLATEAERRQKYVKEQQAMIAGAPGAAPVSEAALGTPQSPQRTGIPITPPVPPGVTPQKWAELHAPLHAKAIEAVEKAAPQFDEAIKTLKLAREHPGREWGVGALSDYAKKIPGSSALGFSKIMEQIGGKNFLAAYQQLKGAGAITEIEGTKAEAAQARLATAQNKEDFDKAMIDFESALRRDLETVQRKVNQPVTAWRGSGDNATYAPDVGERRGNKQYIGGNPSDPMSWRPVQ